MPVARKRKKSSRHHKVRKHLFQNIGEMNEELIKDAAQRAAEAKLPDRERGLYAKWQARRVDGSSDKGMKHHKCSLFILDLDHDPHAIPALFSYASSARADGYELLAGNLFAMIQPYMASLEKHAKDGMPVLDADELAASALTDAELVAHINEVVWADLPGGSPASQLLERMLKRYEQFSNEAGQWDIPKKPKRARKPATKKVKVPAA